ncbi:hypothetical protein E1A91_D09G089400v1 [Gossypium mustelinum]|uniref:Uncharacterized protein n=1 Tax=Gossypium mustelinum TaxID=34275 RepID=A0A5D2TI86_GOSMU|nr:hypothetical protein E1A91_D09G089400v1 [Gossypium mustelinum]
MATENHIEENSNGWPLGLQIMGMRLRLQERLQHQVSAPPVQPYYLHIPSSSFSSLFSSNLDTESSASFFQDNSVSLGKLIGFRQQERGSKHFRNAINGGENIRMPIKATCRDVSRRRQQSADMSQGICIPLILAALVKINKSKSKSKPLDV